MPSSPSHHLEPAWSPAAGCGCGRPGPCQQLLDALPDATAVLDRDGVIVSVNRAWLMFAADNGGKAAATGPGTDYLRVCDRAAAAGMPVAAQVAADLRDVLAGTTVQRDLEYECSSALVERWFTLRMTPVLGSSPGALVSHLNITARRAAEQDLRRTASHDPMTGLANRALLHERLTQSLTARPGRPTGPDVGVLYLDLDGFKQVNDTLGHAAGDEVLVVVARRLQAAVRPQDTVARLGGDEFAVLAPRMSEQGLRSMAQHIREALEVEHFIHGRLRRIRASVGMHLASPGSDPGESLAAADAAMYREKVTTTSGR